jgi:hypothetical protein
MSLFLLLSEKVADSHHDSKVKSIFPMIIHQLLDDVVMSDHQVATSNKHVENNHRERHSNLKCLDGHILSLRKDCFQLHTQKSELHNDRVKAIIVADRIRVEVQLIV